MPEYLSTTSTPQPFALWLTPATGDRRWLSKVIQDFSATHQTPAFEPHVTLYTGVLSPEDCLEEIVQSVFAPETPLTLEVAGLGCTEEFSRSGFIAFESCNRLTQLYQKICNQLSQPSNYSLDPHLSLFYADFPLEQKRLALRRIIFSVKQVTVDTLKIVTPRTGNWLDLDQWQILRSYPLQPGSSGTG